MTIFELSEIFTSLEGEVLIGIPTTYIRFARCNLKCPLFNNFNADVTKTGYATLPFNPKDYDSLKSLPPVAVGCDTQYAVNPEFSHIWYKKTTDELVDEVISKFPKKTPAISLTGGEPTLKWKQIPEILFHPKLSDVKMYIVETNCTVPFKDDFLMDISKWLKFHPDREWIWSNSPKLSNSGHTPEQAIKPNVALMQYSLKAWAEKTGDCGKVRQYFKFVSDGTEKNYQEIIDTMETYYQGGLPRDAEIWLMPEACNNEQQMKVARSIAERCILEGWNFTIRLQNILWDNAVST